MANQPIPVSKATALMTEYRTYMTGLGVDMSLQTQSVSFDPGILSQWLSNILPDTDELKVCLGVYGTGEADAGRITVALWPYKNGQPATRFTGGKTEEIEPFNVGSLEP